jgi:spore germination cell wall hydrolase CwlJ-like protein
MFDDEDAAPGSPDFQPDNDRFVADLFKHLGRQQPYDRVLTVARLSPVFRERGLPDDLHDQFDWSDSDLPNNRASLALLSQSNPAVRAPVAQGVAQRVAKPYPRVGRITGSGPNGELLPRDRDAFVRTLIGEAENQDDDGMQAVASVMGNRSKHDGKAIVDVLDEGNGAQFNSRRGQRRRDTDRIDPKSPIYTRADAIVGRVLAGEDNTNGAYYFYNDRLQRELGLRRPGFDDGNGVRHGDHLFFPWEAGHKKSKR